MAVIGFIGTGNMGGALAQAAAKRLAGGSILLANRTQQKAWALKVMNSTVTTSLTDSCLTA